MGSRLSLFVFVDALGWEVMRRYGFMADRCPFRQPLGTIFGYSSTCDPTILTGLMPRDHGHFAFFYYNPKESPFKSSRLLGLLPEAMTGRGRARRLISRYYKRRLGYTGYFQLYNMPFSRLPLFDYSEKRDLYQPGGINSGAPTIFDHLRKAKVPYSLSDWWLGEEHNLEITARALGEGEVRFAYLYLAHLDAILHMDGPESATGEQRIRWYEEQVGRILQLAQDRYGEVHFHCFSDHGMTPCGEDLDVISLVDSLGLSFGTDYVACYDSTMARFWFLSSRARDLITGLLATQSRGRILSQAQLQQWGCDFPGDKYGQLFFLLNPGVLLCPSFMGRTHLAGMHGFDPDHKDSVASLVSAEKLPLPVNRLDDLFHLMRHEARWSSGVEV